ncbi:MAG TPA: MGMT family protein [Arenicellales bacterium]|nr:MGMT family protein [Arenicellales bacterium]HJP10522.1 MGMT family protein [Arenicellales bacterium]
MKPSAQRKGKAVMRDRPSGLHETIYRVVRTIPSGVVATYGQVATVVGCGPRLVGYAMASLPAGSDIPWQRVINSQGRISVRSDGMPDSCQRRLLVGEGVVFDARGKVDLNQFGWDGPDWALVHEAGLNPLPDTGQG